MRVIYSETFTISRVYVGKIHKCHYCKVTEIIMHARTHTRYTHIYITPPFRHMFHVCDQEKGKEMQNSY